MSIICTCGKASGPMCNGADGCPHNGPFENWNKSLAKQQQMNTNPNTQLPDEYNPIGCEHKWPNGLSAWMFQSERSGSGPEMNECVGYQVCANCGEIRIVGYKWDGKSNHTDRFNEIIHIHHPVQDTMLNNLRVELGSFIREKLNNGTIQIIGQTKIAADDDKKKLFTNRDKFDYLVEKNPLLKEMKDRLGLDTDF